ncbi:MAG TPA: EAL domain-containing protein [Acidimicrobiales bacterium]|nr:EAL domain-containing protein [Acidimicrobiales bacterium]
MSGIEASRFVRLGILSAALAALAAGIFTWRLADEQVLDGHPFVLAWWAIAVLFALGELLEVPLESRGEAHSLTFTEVAFVLGLTLATPADLIIGRVVGGALVLVAVRRQSLPKLMTNLSMFAADAAIASLIYRLVAAGASPDEVRAWAAIVIAMACSHVFGVLVVTAGITILSGWPGREMVGQVAGFGLVVNLANTSVGIAVVSSFWERSSVGLLLLVLVFVLYLLYRAYTRVTERHKSLETLHDFTRGLGGSLELAELERAVVEGTRSILRGEDAVLLVPPIREGAHATRILATGPDVRRISISPTELAADLAILLPDGTARLFEPGQPLPGWLAEIGVKDAAIVPLHNDGTTAGALVVANRLTEVSEFVEEDLRVFETLANHANVALEKGRLVAHLQHEAQEQAYLALHDQVTGLPNRTALVTQLEKAIERAKGSDLRVALLFIDLDTFKEVNDTLGTATAERLLVEVRLRVQAILPPTATLARFGGDQFVVLVSGVTDTEAVTELAEAIHGEFQTPFTADAVSLVLGASLGVALYPEHAASAELLLQRADAAGYMARQEGSGIEVYAAEADPYAPRRLALAADLREALEAEEVDVYVQPKASLADGTVIGAEALVRWTHPRLGPLSPIQFIPAAEHTGVIRSLTHYVVEQGLRQCRQWRDAGYDLSISVNLSARNLFDTHLVEDIGEAIEAAGVPPSALTLELTESTVMGESRRSMAVLEGLHELGVVISVDDFGTGYSSLSHLRQLPVSELKVDKSFVQTMTTTEHDAVIVRALVDLGRSLGLHTVAEGVESTEAWDLLREMGCDVAQGYLLSRPLPADGFVRWLERQTVRRLDPSIVPLRHRRIVGDDT